MDRTAGNKDQQPLARKAGLYPARRARVSGSLALTIAGAAIGLLSLQPRIPALIWNDTESVPTGLYHIETANPVRGDLVVIRPDAGLSHLLETQGSLKPGRLLLKPLAARAGDLTCRLGGRLTVNGAPVAEALTHTSKGAPLPAWSGCHRLSASEILIVSQHPASFDSRYFGVIDAGQVIGVARPLLTLAPAQPTPIVQRDARTEQRPSDPQFDRSGG